jgi:hypothetical protein
MAGRAEVLVEGESDLRALGARVIDLSDRAVSPAFIDTRPLDIYAANLVRQTLESSASKALNGLSLAREYINYGFRTGS